jgi:anaerobic magnesium-protoporphyrin IX monomethyl ester cyclase
MLAMSGADEVWIGAESGSQKILDAMDKGVTVEQIIYSVSLLKQNHIKPCLFLQFGYPGENYSDIQKTIRMLMHLNPFDIGVSVSYPLPGTVFYESVKSSMTDKSNWNDSDELLLMYDGAYGAGFYKKLHRYVHKKFRASQGITELKKIVSNRRGDIRKALLTVYYLPYSLFLGLRIKIFKV